MNEKHINKKWDPDEADDSWDPDTAPDITQGEFGTLFANAPVRRGDPLNGEIVHEAGSMHKCLPFNDSVQESLDDKKIKGLS